MEQVALIGSRLRLPGADTVDAFWQNVLAGRDCIDSLSDAQLLAAGVDPAFSGLPDYVKRAGVLADVDRFDYRFFGYTFREAQAIDPQQRVLLTLAHQLLEQVGAPGRDVGVYTSVGFPHYLLNNLSTQPPGRVALSDVVFGNSGDCASTRIAYKLDLHGPAMSIQSGCSSALMALHNARIAILTGQCRMALVGAAAIRTPQTEGYLYQRDGVLAKDGVCRPFDARASGTVFTNGAVVLALKALSAAQRDGDDIIGVIRGSAINNDGQRKSGYTAPSVAGQSEAIRRAYERSGIGPETIGYVETHGTGTALGDPIEIQALKDAYGGDAGVGARALRARLDEGEHRAHGRRGGARGRAQGGVVREARDQAAARRVRAREPESAARRLAVLYSEHARALAERRRPAATRGGQRARRRRQQRARDSRAGAAAGSVAVR